MKDSKTVGGISPFAASYGQLMVRADFNKLTNPTLPKDFQQ